MSYQWEIINGQRYGIGSGDRTSCSPEPNQTDIDACETECYNYCTGIIDSCGNSYIAPPCFWADCIDNENAGCVCPCLIPMYQGHQYFSDWYGDGTCTLSNDDPFPWFVSHFAGDSWNESWSGVSWPVAPQCYSAGVSDGLGPHSGDINIDGTLDVNDFVLLAQYVTQNTTLTADQILAGDVNRDGNLNLLDAINMVDMLLGRGVVNQQEANRFKQQLTSGQMNRIGRQINSMGGNRQRRQPRIYRRGGGIGRRGQNNPKGRIKRK